MQVPREPLFEVHLGPGVYVETGPLEIMKGKPRAPEVKKGEPRVQEVWEKSI